MKSMYQRSKECVHLNARDFACLKCVFWDSAYSHCRAVEAGWFDKAHMKVLLENLERAAE